MQELRTISIISDKKELIIDVKTILYVIMDGNNAFIHISEQEVYQTRMTMKQIEEALGDNFIKVKRGCLVSIISIHNITDKINLCNGETLDYAMRHKKEIITRFHSKQKDIIKSFNEAMILETKEDYHEYYKIFDNMPFAFTDIEMVFDNEYNAVDWIFRYANPALAKLEKLPLETIIGGSFENIFPNMDTKWLRTYERATLFGETIKIIDYSREIDTYLDIICFPTFKGHCGCILFDISKIKSFRKASETEKALSFFFERLLRGN